jgi:DNA-binding PucR family transcriptional regulator
LPEGVRPARLDPRRQRCRHGAALAGRRRSGLPGADPRTRTPLISQTTADALAVLAADAGTEAQARALLAPIHAVPALAETLRTWLSLHGSWDRTAVALSVHRNTVRQRVSRCAGLLDADLDDPDIRAGLWFALRQTCTSGEQTSS